MYAEITIRTGDGQPIASVTCPITPGRVSAWFADATLVADEQRGFILTGLDIKPYTVPKYLPESPGP